MTGRRFPWAIYWVLFALIGVIGMLPLFTTILSVVVTDAYGCVESEGLLNPCVIGGQDWGSTLQFGGMSFLYVFLTWPLAFVLFLVWLVVLLIHRGAFKRRDRAASGTPS